MRLIASAAPDSSGHYRLHQPIDELTRQGHEGYVAQPGLPIEFSASQRVVDVHVDCEIVVCQRPMMWFMPEVIDVLHRKGIKVVVEIDDDFHTAHPSNTAFMLNHPKRNPKANWHHLTGCIRRADLLTVSTDSLARRYGSHGRVAVLRNCVDDDWLTFAHKGDGHTVGWAGTVLNHPVDLQATRGGVAMALEAHPEWRFLCVGGEKYKDRVQAALELVEEPHTTKWTPLELYPLLVSGIDLGIVPLHESVFNAGKSWLKGIEYAALGIPFVASDLPEYKLLQKRYGLGVLAAPKAKMWRRRLSVIMEADEDVIERHREWSRSQVRTFLTASRNAWRWQEVWETLRCRPLGSRRLGERAVAG